MLDIREVEYWISRYEQEADKLDHCITLSALYTIRDKMLGVTSKNDQPAIAAMYSEATIPNGLLEQYGGSDFLRAISGKNASDVWSIMDDLMDKLRVVNPRVYDGVMRKIDRA